MPNFAGVWLHILQSTVIVAIAIAQKSASFVAVAADKEASEIGCGCLLPIGFGQGDILGVVQNHRVEFASVSAPSAVPVSNVSPRKKIHCKPRSPTEARKLNYFLKMLTNSYLQKFNDFLGCDVHW